MKMKIEELKRAGSVAWLAAGHGPRIAFAPPDDNGAGDDDNGSDDGIKEGGEAAKEGEGDAAQGSRLKRDGLFGKAGKAEADQGESEGDKSGETAKDGIPAKFLDAEGNPKVDDLAKAYRDLEKAHGALKRSKGIGDDVPDNADEYFAEGLELDTDVDRLKIEGPDDPGLKSWGKIAHKYGIGKATAIAIAKEMFKEMNPLAPAPIDYDAEIESLGKQGANMVDGVYTWLEGAEREGKFSDDDVGLITEISKTAAGIRLLSKFRAMTGAAPIPVASAEGRSMSAEDWHSQYRAAVQAGDYKKQESLDTLKEKLWPDGIPQSGIPDTSPMQARSR